MNLLAERELEVGVRAGVGRVRDGDEHLPVVQLCDRDRAVATRDLRGQALREPPVDLEPVQVDEFEAVLLRERLRDVATRRPALLDHDLAQALAALVARDERGAELLRRQDAFVHQHRADP